MRGRSVAAIRRRGLPGRRRYRNSRTHGADALAAGTASTAPAWGAAGRDARGDDRVALWGFVPWGLPWGLRGRARIVVVRRPASISEHRLARSARPGLDLSAAAGGIPRQPAR